MPEIINLDSFEEKVLKSDKPVLVEFYAEWCMPCKMISQSLDSLAREMEGSARVTKIDIDKTPDIVSKYSIKSVPTILLFKNGALVDQVLGAVPKSVLQEKLNSILD